MPQLQVVKLGTSSVFNNGTIDYSAISNIGYNLAMLSHERDTKSILVTSGAIPLGMKQKGLKEKPTNPIELQSCARIGQPLLVNAYTKGLQAGYDRYTKEREIGKLEVLTAQYLVTYHNLDDTSEMRNIVANLMYDTMQGIVPQVNYNDGIDPTEAVRDNDTLSARIAKAVTADRLVMLTDVDGLLDKGGNLTKNIKEINESVRELCGTANGTGGFDTKLDAGNLCLENNPSIDIIIGNIKYGLIDLIDGSVPRTLIKK